MSSKQVQAPSLRSSRIKQPARPRVSCNRSGKSTSPSAHTNSFNLAATRIEIRGSHGRVISCKYANHILNLYSACVTVRRNPPLGTSGKCDHNETVEPLQHTYTPARGHQIALRMRLRVSQLQLLQQRTLKHSKHRSVQNIHAHPILPVV